MASFRNRILVAALLVLGGIGLVSAQTTGAVVSIATAPTVGGACYTGMAIYVDQATGDHWTCAGGVWVLLPGGGGGNADWVKKGIDEEADGTGGTYKPYFFCDGPPVPAGPRCIADPNGDGSAELEIRSAPGGLSKFFMYDTSDPLAAYTMWNPEAFFGALSLTQYSFGPLTLAPDSDNSGGDNRIEVQTNWTGGNQYSTFRFQGTTLTFEGAADDANQVDITPLALTGTRTISLPDKTGGVVLLNGTTYPTGPLCAEWQADGRLGVAGGACGTTATGDSVRIGTTSVEDIDFIDSTDITWTLSPQAFPTPDRVQAFNAPNSIVTGDIQANTVLADDLAATLTFTDGDRIDLSAMNYTSAAGSAEGLRLPQTTTCTVAGYPEGYICWDTNDDKLYIMDSADAGGTDTWTLVSGTGDITDVFDCIGPDCNQITMSSGDYLRANTAGVIGLQESTSNMTDGTTACSSAQIGDMRVDFTGDPNNPELYVCTETAPGFWWFQLFSGVVGQTGVETREDGGAGNTGQGVLDFKAGFDITPASGGVTEIRFDISELSLTHDTIPTPDEYGIWMSGALTDTTPAVCPPDTEDTVVQIPIPVCYGANEKLSFHPAVNLTGCADDVEAYWTCDGFSASSTALVLDNDGGTVGDGTDPEIFITPSITAGIIYFNPNGAIPANWSWRLTNTVIEPRIAVNSEVRACGFIQPSGCGVAMLSTDDDSDGTPDTSVELGASGLKLYIGEGSTTPAIALVTGGIDGNNDGVADNLSLNGLNKSMPNYSESFTSQTSVTMIHDLRSANLVTVCYDGSDNQITPSSVSIGASPSFDVTATFSGSTTGRCVVNGGTNSKYTTSFSSQVAIVIPQADIGMDPYASHVTCYDNENPRNRVEPDSVQIDDASLDMTINFAVGQSGRCVVS